MTAHMVSMIYSNDNSWTEEYSKNVPAIIEKYGGIYSFVSAGKVELAEGDLPIPSGVGTFTFPSKKDIYDFLNCEEYRPFLDLRMKYSKCQILIFDGR